MKRILTSALAIMLFIGAANAQSENKQQRSGKGDHRQMAMNGLDLTLEQKAQIEGINKNYRIQMQDLKGQNLPAEQLKTKRQAIQQQHASDLRALLTPEQKAKLQSSRKAKESGTFPKAKGGKRDAKKDGGLTHQKQQVKKDLNLSAEQEAKMKVVNQSYKAKFESLKQDRSEKKEGQKEQRQALKTERQAAIKAILTPEQQAKMTEHRKRSRNTKK